MFFGACVILPAPDAVMDAGSRGPVVLVVQLNVAVPMVAVGMKFNASPLHVVVAREVDEFVRTGAGFTVTVTGRVGPGQPFTHGVMV